LAILDSGFDLSHRALRHLTDRIVAEWDFVNNDNYTGFDANQDFLRQPEHGTKMLSLIAGFSQGELVGPAFGAEFVLAKTEQVYDTTGRLVEIPQEEQNWVAGLEWADSLGADIVSSSLGYRDFDPGYHDYSNSEMNGHTAVTSITASMAASKGMLVVNAMGNGLESAPRDTSLSAPADAESIVAVGGVGFDSTWIGPTYPYSSYFSACGPTADGRTKPEVVAAWQAWAASYPSTDSFSYISGTSCATALIAGSCALLLDAHPDWTPMELRQALVNSGNFHLTPNDSMGWGIPDLLKAYQTEPAVTPPATSDELLPPYPNPVLLASQQRVWLPYRLTNETEVTLSFFTLSGELLRTLSLGRRMPGRYETSGGAFAAASWDGKNDAGKKVGSGVYMCLLSTGFGSSRQKIAVVR